MPSLHDIYCGRLLIKRKVVTPDVIWSSLRRIHAYNSRNQVVSLVEDLRGCNAITDKHAVKLKQAIERHRVLIQEKLLASLILNRGLMSRATLQSLVDEQRKGDFRQGIGPMMVNGGHLAEIQLAELQAEVSVQYAQTVTESEAQFLKDIAALEEPYDEAQERKVFETLGLTPDRKPKTEGLWSREEAEAAAESARFPRAQDPASSGEASLYESSDANFSAQTILAAVQERSVRPEDCPIYGYEIVEELGKGAMGVVYKARHVFTDRLTALKVLPLNLAKDSQYLERFKREAIACMRLQHENICRAYDFGGSEEYYYLALEFIDGVTLEARLEADTRMPQVEVVRLARDLAAGLEFAWKVGVLHRDIKPENIMINREGVAKLCDFGIVKLVDMADMKSVTMAGTTVGTPYYISPEQAKGQDDLDVRSDLYSLGITLFHAVTGQVPFTGKSQGAILVRHILEDVPDPRSVYPEVAPEVAEIIGRLTRKKRDERFQTPAELKAAVEGLPAPLRPA